MKKLFKVFSIIVLSFCSLIFTSCESKETYHDYVNELKLDLDSNTLKMDAKVKTYVDGDTTHFNVSSSNYEGSVIKVRYLAINTPESTGRIEEYGKAASNFTKSILEKAESIILESNDNKWNLDTTGSRILCWVWYRENADADYRNLNLEILQNGYAKGSSIISTRYGEICMSAFKQAQEQKLNIYSGEKDPLYYYGEAVELDLKELRLNPEEYVGIKVAFNGTVIKVYSNTAYVEYFDEETELYFGLPVYLGNTSNGELKSIVNYGNEVRIVGVFQFYSTGGVYQVSGCDYHIMDPDNPSNVKLLSKNHTPSYVNTSAELFSSKKKIFYNDEEIEFDYSYLTLSTSIEVDNITCKEVYTTRDEDSSSNGAVTLTCYSNQGTKIIIRTIPLYKDNKMITEDYYLNKTINVKGVVDLFNGEYQIKVYYLNDINII